MAAPYQAAQPRWAAAAAKRAAASAGTLAIWLSWLAITDISYNIDIANYPAIGAGYGIDINFDRDIARYLAFWTEMNIDISGYLDQLSGPAILNGYQGLWHFFVPDSLFE